MAKAVESFSGLISPSALAKAMPYRDFDVAKLRRDGGTQQRPTDPTLVEEYAQMRRDGSEPPPVRAVLDPEGNMWLWEGFHRYEAAVLAGKPTLNLSVTRGTQRDAQALSFAANKQHGLRRQPGVVRQIVNRIVSDPEWSKASNAAIAEHVGASVRYVEEIVAAAKAGGKERPATREVTRKGKTYEMNTAAIKGNRAEKPAGNGQAATAESPAPEEKKPEPVTADALGNAIDDPAIIEVFTRAPEIAEHMRALSAVRRAVLAAAEPPKDEDERKRWRPDPLYAALDVAGFKSEAKNAWDDLKFAIPHALCPAHAADKLARKDCKWCKGRGWVTERGLKLHDEAKNAPAETAGAKA